MKKRTKPFPLTPFMLPLLSLFLPAEADSPKAGEVLCKLMAAQSWYYGNKDAAMRILAGKKVPLDSGKRMYARAESFLESGDTARADTLATRILFLLDIDWDTIKNQPFLFEKDAQKREAIKTICRLTGKYGYRTARLFSFVTMEMKEPADYTASDIKGICDRLSATPEQRDAVLQTYKKAGKYAFESALANFFSHKRLYSYFGHDSGYKKAIDEALGFKKTAAETEKWVFEIDAAESIGVLIPFWNACVDAGSPCAEHRSAFLGSVNYADRHAALSAVRVFIGEPVWHKMYRETPGETPAYDFSRINEILDPVALGKKRRIIVCLYGMPAELSANPRALNSYGAVNACYPKDFKKWKNYIKAMIRYLENRYGKESLRRWYFECWNEPEAFGYYRTKPPGRDYKWWEVEKAYTESEYMDGVTNFIKLYDWTAQAVVEADSLYKIGGVGYMCPADRKFYNRANPFMADLVKHCARDTNYATGEKGTRLDFLSFHVYGVAKLESFTSSVVSLLGRFPELGRPELLVDEFHGVHFESFPSLNNYDACAFIYGVDYCRGLRKDGWNITQLAYFPLIGNPELLPETRNDGSTPLLSYGYSWFTWFLDKETILPLPTFNAVRMLSMMGGDLIGMKNSKPGNLINGFAAKDRDGKITVLLNSFDKLDIANRNSSRYAKKCEVRLSGLTFKKARMTRYRVSEEDNNFRLAWVKMGRPEVAKMTGAQWKSLEEIARLAKIHEKRGIEVKGGKLECNFIMESQSVTLLVIEGEE